MFAVIPPMTRTFRCENETAVNIRPNQTFFILSSSSHQKENFFGMLLLLPKLYLCSGLRSAILSTLRECAQIDWALSCTRKMQIDKSLQDNWSSGQSVHTEF